jgi:hypothetical protein
MVAPNAPLIAPSIDLMNESINQSISLPGDGGQ